MTHEHTQTVQRFPIQIGRRSRLLLRVLFGVTQANAFVELSESDVHASFGFYHLRFPLANVARWSIEGPWLWLTAIGVRRGIRHGDISFDGNHMAGVRLDFKQPERWSFLRIPRFYVTVADPEAFGAALVAAGIPGEDARARSTS